MRCCLSIYSFSGVFNRQTLFRSSLPCRIGRICRLAGSIRRSPEIWLIIVERLADKIYFVGSNYWKFSLAETRGRGGFRIATYATTSFLLSKEGDEKLNLPPYQGGTEGGDFKLPMESGDPTPTKCHVSVHRFLLGKAENERLASLLFAQLILPTENGGNGGFRIDTHIKTSPNPSLVRRGMNFSGSRFGRLIVGGTPRKTIAFAIRSVDPSYRERGVGAISESRPALRNRNVTLADIRSFYFTEPTTSLVWRRMMIEWQCQHGFDSG